MSINDLENGKPTVFRGAGESLHIKSRFFT